MDLLGKVVVIVLVLVIVFTAVFVLSKHTTNTPLTAAQAVQFVINDLRASNPGANITVINVSNSTLKAGSYDVVLSIVYNATRPCPTLFIEAFDYPATGLVPSIDNLYTKNCIIYGLSGTSPLEQYVISSPQIAIARSYNQGIGQITNYVSTFGYNNTVVTAKFYPYLNENYTHLGQSFYNVWLIKYKATGINYSVYAVLDSSGAVAGNYTSIQ
jgi:hypothetical protein